LVNGGNSEPAYLREGEGYVVSFGPAGEGRRMNPSPDSPDEDSCQQSR